MLRTLTEVKGRKTHFFGWGNCPWEEVTAGEIVSRGLWGSDAVLTIRQPGKGMNAGAEMQVASGAAGAEMQVASGAARAAVPVAPSVKIAVQVPLPGRHMVLNSAAAACVAGLLGLSPEQIASGIRKIKPVGGRNNLIPLAEYTLIDECYNANPASMKAAVDLLSMADTEKVAILGDMFELGENSRKLHEEIGAYAAEAGIHRIYCVGNEAESIYQAACGVMSSGQSPNGDNGGETIYFPTKEELFRALEEDPARYIPKGSTVLIKASHGMEFNQIVDYLKRKVKEPI